MELYLQAIEKELGRTRALVPQVVAHILGQYGATRDDLGRFLREVVPGLEDYQIDVMFSPIFTPGILEQALYSKLVIEAPLEGGATNALVQALCDRRIQTPLRLEDGAEHRLPLREVTLNRYVSRLNLERVIPEPLAARIQEAIAPDELAIAHAIARRPVWATEGRENLLHQFLGTTLGTPHGTVENLSALMRLVETYRPATLEELIASLPELRELLRREMANSAMPRPFFNERVRDLHGGGRDQRGRDEHLIESKQREAAFLELLQTQLSPQAP